MSETETIPPHIADSIPQPLLEKLLKLQPVLARQGIVQRRGRAWRLRYRGVGDDDYYHHSISLGADTRKIVAVKTLLASWKNAVTESKTEALRQKEQARAERAERADLKRHTVLSVAGGSRLKAKARRWFEKAWTDPMEKLKFSALGKVPVKAGRPGRPNLCRLW